MWRWTLRTAGVVIISSLFLVSPASASERVYVRVGPPARVVETVPARRRGFVWQGGYQRWNGHRYVWVPGRYARPPYARAGWVSSRWAHSPRGYYFVPGHWVRR
jgi:YXWGXW repeat-containing protein